MAGLESAGGEGEGRSGESEDSRGSGARSVVGLTDADRSVLFELLTEQHRRALQMVCDSELEIEGIMLAAETANVDDEHDPEGSTIAFERAREIALRERSLSEVAEISLALERLRDGKIGICEGCGRETPFERLATRPASRHCVSCADEDRRSGRRSLFGPGYRGRRWVQRS